MFPVGAVQIHDSFGHVHVAELEPHMGVVTMNVQFAPFTHWPPTGGESPVITHSPASGSSPASDDDELQALKRRTPTAPTTPTTPSEPPSASDLVFICGLSRFNRA